MLPIDSASANKEALVEMARTYYRYAASGIQDSKMAAWYFRSAERYAGKVSEPEGIFVRAGALGRLGRFEDAEACLETLPSELQAAPEACLTRAEIAFQRRDFAAAREEAAQMQQAGADLPDWLAALGPPAEAPQEEVEA